MESRRGSQHRANPDRYFHVMGQGWFVHLREGVGGPFVDQSEAKSYLTGIVSNAGNDEEAGDPSEKWRF